LAEKKNAGECVRLPDAILLDLGISTYHYEESGRGFSFRNNEELDMRLDNARGRSAAALLASYSEKEIADMLYKNAEERYSYRIAAAIVRARKASPVRTSAALLDIVKSAVPSAYRYGRISPATKTFQALRIEVNSELSRLPALLAAAFEALAEDGRLAVISFHSLEDRIVKHFFREKKMLGLLRLVNNKALTATEAERSDNPASRSAKLRVAEKGCV
jgi:16S rRNA (cytosine1402-N4)-methyltransferase